jgi:hypothetical protein
MGQWLNCPKCNAGFAPIPDFGANVIMILGAAEAGQIGER